VGLIVVSDRSGAAFRSADALVKPPLTMRKVMYRVRKCLQGAGGSTIQGGDLTLLVHERKVIRGEEEITLTPKLRDLLLHFMRNPGKDLTRKMLMKAVWDTEYLGDTRTLDVHVHWLRKRVETDPKNPVRVRTVRGVGYRFDPVG